ncbi:MAG TPA: GNAT family N-acetyltransferase [Candidatus Obscuribacterales bacterium]
MQIEQAAFNDHQAIASLLSEAKLPVPDERDSPVHFLIAREKGRLIGCLGWERYENRCLLRSLAVDKGVRRQGIATALVTAALAYLKAQGVSEFYLLTNDAADFARRFHFISCDRHELPPGIQSSRQIATNCCASAVCMRLEDVRLCAESTSLAP